MKCLAKSKVLCQLTEYALMTEYLSWKSESHWELIVLYMQKKSNNWAKNVNDMFRFS